MLARLRTRADIQTITGGDVIEVFNEVIETEPADEAELEASSDEEAVENVDDAGDETEATNTPSEN